MKKFGISYRMLFPIPLFGILACSLVGDLLPQKLGVSTSALSPTAETTMAETATSKPTITRRPSSTPTPKCIDPAGSKNKSDRQKEVESMIPGADVI